MLRCIDDVNVTAQHAQKGMRKAAAGLLDIALGYPRVFKGMMQATAAAYYQHNRAA